MQHPAHLTVIATSIAASAATLVLALSPAWMPLAPRATAENLRVVELPRVVVSAAREPRVVQLPRAVVQIQRATATAQVGAAATPMRQAMSRQPS